MTGQSVLSPNAAKTLRVAAVVNWPDQGKWLWKYLPPDSGVDGDILIAALDPEETARRKEQGKKFRPYFTEFEAFRKRNYALNDYDVIFCWEMRALLPLLLQRRLTGQRRAKVVVIAPILKGELFKIIPFLRILCKDVDRFICVASGECDLYAEILRLPRERFSFHPVAWLSEEEPVYEHKGFALALGQSNRNYGLLLDAIEGTGIPLTIVAGNGSFLEGRTLPDHVTVKFNTGHHETNALIADATFHIVPLTDVKYASGSQVLLRAMARGKAVIFTDTMGASDYIKEGKTGLLVPPGDVGAMRAAIEKLWHDTELRDRIGHAAAKSVREEFTFERMAASMARIAHELTRR